jgi:dolichyl-phosphooligosaccharide-protein glycotransferase
MNSKKIITSLAIFLGVSIIVFLAIWVRSSTINSKTVLDYDPFWYYRHAQDIENNNFTLPKWDELSYYPPGRPAEKYSGWAYTIVIFHKILQQISPAITLTQAAIFSPLIMVGLTAISAFFIGRQFSNSIGGLATAFFLVLTPTFIGVSMAGYSDNDSVQAFYVVLTTLLTIIAVKKSRDGIIKAIPYILLAIASNLLFIYNWGGGWITLLFFTFFIPGLFIFRIFEGMVHNRKFKVDIESIKIETKPIFMSLLIILAVTNIVGFSLGWGSEFNSLLGGLAFTSLASKIVLTFLIAIMGLLGFIVGIVFFKKSYGRIICMLVGLGIGIWLVFFSNVTTAPLLVNISVAELQTLQVFSSAGFMTVVDRVGLLPTVLTVLLIPFFPYKIYKKEKISYIEIFLFMWALVSIFLITRGVRFALLFSIAATVISGYIIGNLFSYLRKKSTIVFSIIFGIIALLAISFLSNAIQLGNANTGMILSQNWYDALDWLKAHGDKNTLVTTWWDPGHIITGYTGLKVMADGAHCDITDCIPYNHNIRIRDMGRTFSTTNETESVSILDKYVDLTPEQRKDARDKWGQIMPADAFDPVDTMYVIASSDLIQKYYWLSYFGSYNDSTQTGDGRNYIYFQFSGFDQSGFLTYKNSQIPLTITLLEKDGKPMAVANYPQQGIRNAVIRDLMYFQNSTSVKLSYNSTNNTLDGLFWVDPGFTVAIFMDSQVRDSIFTNMFFFDGNGVNEFNISKLSHFELVYENPEIKIFKVGF